MRSAASTEYLAAASNAPHPGLTRLCEALIEIGEPLPRCVPQLPDIPGVRAVAGRTGTCACRRIRHQASAICPSKGIDQRDIGPAVSQGSALLRPHAGLTSVSLCPRACVVHSQVHSAIVEGIDKGTVEPVGAPLILRIEPGTGRGICWVKRSIVVERESAMSPLHIRNAPDPGLTRASLQD